MLMKESRTVRNDLRILEYGKHLFAKHGHRPHKTLYIAQKLRELGRLVLIAQTHYLNTIDECLEVKNWDILIKCVKEVAGYDEATHKYQTPSLPLKIGHSLVKCARYLRSASRKVGDMKKLGQADLFLEQYRDSWEDDVSTAALETLHDGKLNKPRLIPVTEDVVKFNKFLKEKAEELCRRLKEKYDTETYKSLAKTLLTVLIIFNRKRSGEVERMKIENFTAVLKDTNIDLTIKESLTKFEQELCATHYRVEIVGKRGRHVPVLLTDDMKNQLTVLLKYRPVTCSTEYLFARVEGKTPYKGSEVLRRSAAECPGLQHPQLLTSTLLRKQVATLAQLLNLKDVSQDMLATFLGHDIRVHRDYYRLPENTLQLAKISKILHAVNSGRIAEFQGKDFDEIEFSEGISDEEEEDDQDNAVKDKGLRKTLDSDEGHQHRVDEPTFTCLNEVEHKGLTKWGSHEEVQDKSLKKSKKGKAPKMKAVMSGKGGSRAVRGNTRHTWTTEEKDAIMRTLGDKIRLGKVPGKVDILFCQQKEPGVLGSYRWEAIKFCSKNMITSRQKKLGK